MKSVSVISSVFPHSFQLFTFFLTLPRIRLNCQRPAVPQISSSLDFSSNNLSVSVRQNNHHTREAIYNSGTLDEEVFKHVNLQFVMPSTDRD